MVLKLPRNWNPVSVRIRALSLDASDIDPVFKVPLTRKSRPNEYVYNAQVNLGAKTQDRKAREDTGDRTDTAGHLVLRLCDLEPHEDLPKPKKGWLIVALYADTPGEVDVEYLIDEVRHESPKRGQPLLLYVEFSENIEKARTP